MKPRWFMIDLPEVLPSPGNAEVAAPTHTFLEHYPQPRTKCLNFTQVGSWKRKCQLCCLCEGKSQDVGTDLPPNLNAQWQGRLGACLAVSTSDHRFLSTSASSHSARLRGHPLPPSWSRAAMPYCAMLRRNDCFIPSQWWLHINRGLMSPLSIT